MAKLEHVITEKNSENGISNDASNEKVRTTTTPSANSGSISAKYQLRPRSVQQRRESDSEWFFHDRVKYSSRQQPLSRYRRKSANARERYRMRQINNAFQNLRGVLPSWVCSRREASDLTKISTLKLASAYIRSLQNVLEGKPNFESCSISAHFPTSSSSSPSSSSSSSSFLSNSSYSWIASSKISTDTNDLQECQLPSQSNGSVEHQQCTTVHVDDMMSIVYGNSALEKVADDLDSLPCMSHTTQDYPVDTYLLGCEQNMYPWVDGKQVPIAT